MISPEPEGLFDTNTADNHKLYTEKLINHALHPRNMGTIENADGYAKITGPCGDTMEVWLNVRNDKISDISFMTDGCGTSITSGSMMTTLAHGKSIGEAAKISQKDILDALGGMPEESQHCALLAANTLKKAISDCLIARRDPWKKLYRRYQG